MVRISDKWAAEYFYKYEELLKKYAFSLCRDISLSEDCVQETFLKLCKQREKDIKNVKSWLYTVCRNEVYGYHRKNKMINNSTKIQHYKDEDKSPAEKAFVNDDLNKLSELLKALPKTKKEIIRLKFQGQFSYKEISQITGQSVSNIGYILCTTLKELKMNLA